MDALEGSIRLTGVDIFEAESPPSPPSQSSSYNKSASSASSASPNAYTYSSNANDYSFEHITLIDTFINVSDDILNMSVEDVCVGDLSPIKPNNHSNTMPFTPSPGHDRQQEKQQQQQQQQQQSIRELGEDQIPLEQRVIIKIESALSDRYEGPADEIRQDEEECNNNYSSLIRDLECPSPNTPGATSEVSSPVCQLNFSGVDAIAEDSNDRENDDEHDDRDSNSESKRIKAVVVNDDMNTVRYFSRSKEEKAFVGQYAKDKKRQQFLRKQLRQQQHKKALFPTMPKATTVFPIASPVEPNAYSPPLADKDKQAKKAYAEDDIVAAMADLVTEQLRGVERSSTHLRAQMTEWADQELLVEKWEGASIKFKSSLEENLTDASSKVKEAYVALKSSLNQNGSEPTVTALSPVDAQGFPTQPTATNADAMKKDRPRSVSLSQTFEKSTYKLKATIEESSNHIIRSMAGETLLCMSSQTASDAANNISSELNEEVEIAHLPEYMYGPSVITDESQETTEQTLHSELLERAFSGPFVAASTISASTIATSNICTARRVFDKSSYSSSRIADFCATQQHGNNGADLCFLHRQQSLVDTSTDSSHQSLERSFSDPTHLTSANNVDDLHAADEYEYDFNADDDYKLIEGAISADGASTEVLLRQNGKIVMAEVGSDALPCQTMQAQKVSLYRKRNVVNGARRWNKSQDGGQHGGSKSAGSTPVGNSEGLFLEMEQDGGYVDIMQPIFREDEMSLPPPVTPTPKSSRKSRSSLSSDKTAKFRKAAEFFKKMEFTKSSPVSALEL